MIHRGSKYEGQKVEHGGQGAADGEQEQPESELPPHPQEVLLPGPELGRFSTAQKYRVLRKSNSL